MTIREILRLAPDVPAEAEKRVGVISPFISLKDLGSLCEGNEVLEVCLQDLVTLSLRYTETVCRFGQIVSKGQTSNEDGGREEIERLRSNTHNATISSIDILSRNLKNAGRDTKWMSVVKVNGRASYGKFAIFIAFEAVREAREKDMEKHKLLRYAELIMKRQRIKREGETFPQSEEDELNTLRQEFKNLKEEEILRRAEESLS